MIQLPPEPMPVPEIVVTGRGLREGAGEAAFGGVTIGRERLANAPSTRLEEVLRDVPGFQLFRRSDARSANPTSQGATLRGLGGNASSRVLLLLDGVPQTDPFGGWVSWPAYDPRRLAEARVTRGGGSGVNGPGALAGTIELTSAGPGEADGLAASLAYGSRDSLDAFALYGSALGAGNVTVSASHAQGDGFVPVIESQRGPGDRPSPYEQTSLSVRGVAPVSGTTEFQASVVAFSDARERGTALSDIRTRGADAALRLVGSGAVPFSALVYLQTRDFSNQFAALDAERREARLTLDQYSVPSTGLGARAEVRPRLGTVELRLGADWRETIGQSQELFQYVAGAPTRAREAGGRTRTVGAFAEAGLEQGPLSATAGVRIDRWWIWNGRLDERLLATGAPLTAVGFADRSGWRPTGRAGVAWAASEVLSLRGAAYLGWRLPTLNELYRPFRVGADATAANSDLAPERLRGVEVGLDVRPARAARIGLTLFNSRTADAIGNVTLARGPGLFPGVGFVAAGGQYRQRQNLDAIRSRGLELDGQIGFGPWQLSAGYSYSDAQVRASGAAAGLNGLRPAQTPRHSASTTLAWSQPQGAAASLSARYTGSQFEDDLNRQLIPDALTFDAAASLPIGGGFALEGRAENLTNEEVVAGISGAGIVERATPRTVWLGLRWRG